MPRKISHDTVAARENPRLMLRENWRGSKIAHGAIPSCRVPECFNRVRQWQKIILLIVPVQLK